MVRQHADGGRLYGRIDGGHSLAVQKNNTRRAATIYASAHEAVAALEHRYGRCSADWTYQNAKGEPVGIVIRWDRGNKKEIRPISRTGQGWVVGGMPAPRPLYRLPELAAAPRQRRYVCEGEKAADAARGIGLIATTSPHGSKSAAKADWTVLAGSEVVILPDADAAGDHYADDVVGILSKLTPAPLVKIVRLPDLPFGEGGDIADFVALRGGDAEAVRSEVEALADCASPVDHYDQWPDFSPLSEPIDAPFPVEVLPAPIRRWVEAEANATQTPAALSALLALAVIGAAAAKRYVVEPWQGWREFLNLFVAVLLDPGNRKSAVFNDATKPLRELEAEITAKQRPEVEKALAQRRIDEARLKKLEKDASDRDDAQARDDALMLAAKLADEPIPAVPRLIADNATPEKLEILLAEQEGRLASMSAEGGVFDIMAGRYSDGAASFDVYLKGHAADDLRTDRVGRAGVHVKAPALTCAYAIQPAVIAGLADKPSFRGRGLLARFLYALPRSPVGQRVIRPAPVPECVQDEYFQIVQGIGVVSGEWVLHFDREAEAAFEEWMTEIESMLDIGGNLEHLRDWGGKLAGLTLRLAGIMHVASSTNDIISEATIRGAIAIARWSIPHAEAALNLMRAAGAANEGAAHVWAWIRRHGLNGFTGREAWQAIRRRFDKREHLDEALTVLVERGYIRPIQQDRSGPGRRSQAFEIRPALRNDHPVSRTQNPLCCSTSVVKVNSVDFVNVCSPILERGES